jgi:hypothetical protein
VPYATPRRHCSSVFATADNQMHVFVKVSNLTVRLAEASDDSERVSITRLRAGQDVHLRRWTASVSLKPRRHHPQALGPAQIGSSMLCWQSSRLDHIHAHRLGITGSTQTGCQSLEVNTRSVSLPRSFLRCESLMMLTSSHTNSIAASTCFHVLEGDLGQRNVLQGST